MFFSIDFICESYRLPPAVHYIAGQSMKDSVQQISTSKPRTVLTIVSAFGMRLKPFRLICRMIEYYIRQRQHSPLCSHPFDQLFQVFESTFLFAGTEYRIQFQLIPQTVRRVGSTQILNGCEVNHIIAGPLRHLSYDTPLKTLENHIK